MNITIFGLGYVGCISLGCLAQNGHRMIGVDVNPEKNEKINEGKATVIEKDIEEIIKENQHNILATDDFSLAIAETDAAIICVGTPSSETGQLNLEYIKNVAGQIGISLSDKESFFTIFIRSTVPPGTNKEVGEIIARKSGKKKNIDFAIVSNPEFLREGSAVKDYYNPPYTILGSESRRGIEVGKIMYKDISAPLFETKVEEAEILKYINNSFHALKITFANEVGNICKSLGVDSHKVMELFAKDTKLNISPAYLKPGFAYGGSCLPKDLKALNTFAHGFYLDVPVLNAIEQSNQKQIWQAYKLIQDTGNKRVGVIGLSFKPGTDDLRYSPVVDLVEKLLGKGFKLAIYDRNVRLSKLTGGNKSFIQLKLPHIGEFLVEDCREAISHSDVLVFANNDKAIETIEVPESKIIIDLAGIDALKTYPNYKGLAW